MAVEKMTAADIRRMLYNHFYPRWAVVFEVTARTSRVGAQTDLIPPGQDHARRIDVLLVRRQPRRETAAAQRERMAAALAIARQRREQEIAAGQQQLFPAATLSELMPPPPAETASNGGLQRFAIEIKVSRSDFLSDINNPGKQAPWREMAEQHAYCVPAGLVARGEVPAASGLIQVSSRNGVVWARKAPRITNPVPLPLDIQLDAFYRWGRAEALAQGLDWEGRRDGDDMEELRRELARLRKENELAQRRHDRDYNIIAVMQARLALATPPPCSTCARPLRPFRKGMTSGDVNWTHLAADEEACRPLRRAVDGGLLWVPDPRPVDEWADAEVQVGQH